ncbi:hypothetical protein AAJ76_500037549 [Vairimorpha ceranae]|uniref:Uncharacterized protein n=1 Tax=Vairimorpha ceranae TaxID=40302 RepID=A0A0F9ZFT0_9MICR|nr:hypothetical protein AAJ76_500037549 [Vairimorpha ceranae]KKO76224.1 hypothetical protein AAJ76_500037549 [Vairimorpha ceranae]
MIKINIFQPKFFKLLNLVICLNINIVKFFSDTFNCEKCASENKFYYYIGS